jgi:hypothetical protein
MVQQVTDSLRWLRVHWSRRRGQTCSSGLDVVYFIFYFLFIYHLLTYTFSL